MITRKLDRKLGFGLIRESKVLSKAYMKVRGLYFKHFTFKHFLFRRLYYR